MPIDFNAFRSMASKSPDKAIYVQGDTLKATSNTATKSVDKFQSATTAFIDACKTRYGAAMADALQRHLQGDIAAGKPLTTRSFVLSIAMGNILREKGVKVDMNAVALGTAGHDTKRRQLMAEAKRLTELTQPRYPYKVERNQIEGELMELGPGPEFNVKNARHEQLDSLMHDSEIEQTEIKTDAQIVELVENAIRDNPKDFPLLTKYYLNAE